MKTDSCAGQCTGQCAGEMAGVYFQDGFHCAEAVASAILESKGMDPTQAIMHATAFGGGMGRSFTETCGAISGGLIAIGHLHGRTKRGESWDTPAAMGSQLRDRFIEGFGETNCGVLRDRFGEEQNAECTKIVEIVTKATLEVLDSEPTAP